MWKRFVVAVALMSLWSALGFAQTRRTRQPSARAEGPNVNIIQVDFMNYTFPLNGQAYKLIDGFYAEAAGRQAQWGLMLADGPYYGDLTGDKKEEAAFVFRYGPVGGF